METVTSSYKFTSTSKLVERYKHLNLSKNKTPLLAFRYTIEIQIVLIRIYNIVP